MNEKKFRKYFKRALISNLLFWGTMTYMVFYIAYTDQLFGTTTTGAIPDPSGLGIAAWLGIIAGAGGIAALFLAGGIALVSWWELIFETVTGLYDLAAGKLIERRS